MTVYDSLSRWAALALGVASLLGVGAALVFAAPARTAATAFELTLETALAPPLFMSTEGGTFRSRAPFCTSGTFVEFDNELETLKWRFTCEDGSGSLTVGLLSDASWRIIDGSGSYAGLRGGGSERGEQLCKPWLGENCDLSKPIPWRATLVGLVDWGAEPEQLEEGDTVAPTITFSTASATKLHRPAGAYSIRIIFSLRDDVEGKPIAYRLSVTQTRAHRLIELASREDTTATGSVTTTLRVVPGKRVRRVQVRVSGWDPAGNEASIFRSLRLPR